MRQGQQNNNNKRMRGRNRKGPNPLSRSYESNGPDVKVRGTALHIAEKYMQLARDAQSSGDRVQAESYLQHAEHYYRIVSAAQAQNPQQPQQVYRNDNDGYGDDDDDRSHMSLSDQRFQPFPHEQPSYGGGESQQPYVNGNGAGNGNGQERRDEQPAAEAAEEGQPDPQAQPQPEAGFRPEGGEPPREGRREGFRPRRRRPYRERAAGAPEGGGPQPEGAGAGGED
jgi:hypothetical protein